MPIYQPRELHKFLDELGVRPQKRLSQNFLVDGNILKKIVKTAEVSPDDLVVEIGSGPGSLTEELLASGAELIAVEKDRVFAKALERLKTREGKLDIYCDDIMTFPLDEILRSKLPEGKKAKVIANLPYHLTTPIVAKLVEKRNLLSSLVLMVQDDVAKRFVASHKTSEYSSFTIFLNFFTDPKYAFKVTRHCFYPAPKVDSAIVVLNLKEPPLVKSQEAFFQMTRTAFNQRRKMLRSSLKEIYPSERVEAALMHIGISRQSRPEELSLNNFLELYSYLTSFSF